ncbi:MAG: peptidoglycan-binding protein, partial [Actinomycetota bacterium]|nr:peptidoglycan-binding protein [Actinomycetota bacterium]
RLHTGSAGPTVTALQAALGLRVVERTGYFGRRTRSLVREVKESLGLASNAVVTKALWQALP